MASHSEHAPEEGVDTSEVNYTAVLAFVVVFCLAVFIAFMVVKYLFAALLYLEEYRKTVDDPQVAERHKLMDGAEVESLRLRYLVVKVGDKIVDKRDYPEEKQINDSDWQEFKVALNRVQVQGYHRAQLPPEPTIESADVLNPFHSGAIRDDSTLGHENIKAGKRILNPDPKDAQAISKLKAEKKLTINESFKAILDKGLIKTGN